MCLRIQLYNHTIASFPHCLLLIAVFVSPLSRLACHVLHTGFEGPSQDSVLETAPWGFDYSSIKAPTLLYHGIDDPEVPVMVADYLYGHTPLPHHTIHASSRTTGRSLPTVQQRLAARCPEITPRTHTHTCPCNLGGIASPALSKPCALATLANGPIPMQKYFGGVAGRGCHRAHVSACDDN